MVIQTICQLTLHTWDKRTTNWKCLACGKKRRARLPRGEKKD